MIKFSGYSAQLNLALLALLALGASTASAQEPVINGAPASISNIYSDIDMRVRLATKPDAETCSGEQCELNSEFDTQVQRVGDRLATAAYNIHPDLSKRVPSFTFSVADKKASGIASNGAGKIVIFRGIQDLDLSEDAIAFILAREMGHVIGRHHNKNATTKILFSVLASVLFPAVTLLSASNVAAQATTSMVTSFASSATSYFGSEAAISKVKPAQLIESDDIAVALLDANGWDMRSVASTLQFDDVAENGWLKDLHTSTQRLNDLIGQADANALTLETKIVENFY